MKIALDLIVDVAAGPEPAKAVVGERRPRLLKMNASIATSTRTTPQTSAPSPSSARWSGPESVRFDEFVVHAGRLSG